MKWFRAPSPRDPLAVTMTGVKLGDRLLVIGGGHVKLVAQLSLKPGLTGRTCILDEDADRSARAAAAAEAEGALVESETAPHTMLPHNDSAFDIVVLNHVLSQISPDRRVLVLNEARRVLRDGGRAIAIEPESRGGLGSLFGRSTAPPSEIEQAFRAAGYRGVRTLAQRDGLAFVEGARRN